MSEQEFLVIIGQIHERLGSIEQKLTAVHTPSGCGLNERVRALELNEAHQRGVMVVIGSVAGMVASAIISFLFKRT